MKLLFDAREDSLPTVFGITAVCAIGIATIVWVYRNYPFGSSKAYRMTVLGLLLFGFVGYLLVSFVAYWKIVRALDSGSCHVLVGRVEHFHPFPGNGLESFEVDGHRFEYTEYSVSLGFQKMSVNHGPIHDGLLVKVYALGRGIVRLEVEEPTK